MSLLFRPEHIEAIRAGTKTVTRRDWADGYPRPKVGSIRGATTEMFTPTEEIDCWLRIERVYQEPLGDMDDADARAEGGYDMADFRDAWRDINGEWDPNINGEWDPKIVVDVIEFSYEGRERPEADSR